MRRKERKGMHRRDFLRKGVTTSVAAATVGTFSLVNMLEVRGAVARHVFFLALGDTLIPSSKASPGFKSMESLGITQELSSQLSTISDEDLQLFNEKALQLFGKTFLELNPANRAAYLRSVLDGSDKIGEVATLRRLQGLLRLAKARTMSLFYRNFPEHRVKRDAKGNPIVEVGNEHMIFNPNTRNLQTAWDTTGFGGPLTWEQEERRRRKFGPLWKAYERKTHS